MAGKNTAAFGIYRTQADVEYAVDLLRAEGFRIRTSRFSFPKTGAQKTSRQKRAPRRRKEQLPASRPAPLLAELWAGSQALVRCRSLG